ncbi:MAG: hypothetical protein HON43_02205 [Alphaproteobacteria bacterium]|jgi:hypothetical protein|nr:hypothetical protein [Alphaproteobacteria bacterium]MBT5389550.1 hypothetical protein [Alphaproteobacteria bacterium]MBT5540189.1 hypothetical protein [Alphaproteobacteria bacterium]
MRIFVNLIILLSLAIFPNIGLAVPDEIELSDHRQNMPLVGSNGKIFNKYRTELLGRTGVNAGIEIWSSFKASLDGTKKGIAGEVAANFFFQARGYEVLEEHYAQRLGLLKGSRLNEDIKKDSTCTTKKGPDNGIDGIFVLKEEDFTNPSHIIINESKFRNKLSLSENDFGFVTGSIQQSHSSWNSPRFGWGTCLPQLNYDSKVIIRTATLLNSNGEVLLYEIRDKDASGTKEGEYASKAPSSWNIRKAYDKHLKN